MNKFGAALLGMAGVFVGVVGFMIAVPLRSEVASLKSEHKKDQAALTQLRSKLEALDQKLSRPDFRPGEPSSDLDAPDSAPQKSVETVRPPQAKPSTGTEPGAAAEDFAQLQKKVMAGTATDEEKEEFWRLAREKPGLLDAIIKQLEKGAADDSRNKEAHRRLAEAYLAKLMSVPDGMEKGIWSNKMISEEKKILEIDPGDWEARFSVATNYSFWPEQFNKRPDAIKEFETLKRLQESRPADPKYAQTYLQLRQLYLKEGRVDDAKALLEEGLRHYPNDAELIKARDGAK